MLASPLTFGLLTDPHAMPANIAATQTKEELFIAAAGYPRVAHEQCEIPHSWREANVTVRGSSTRVGAAGATRPPRARRVASPQAPWRRARSRRVIGAPRDARWVPPAPVRTGFGVLAATDQACGDSRTLDCGRGFQIGAVSTVDPCPAKAASSASTCSGCR